MRGRTPDRFTPLTVLLLAAAPLSLAGCVLPNGREVPEAITPVVRAVVLPDPYPTTAPATSSAVKVPTADDPPADHWAYIGSVLGRKGVEEGLVYTVTVPRDDWVVTLEGMELPTAAGLASVFHFYRCPCGKTVIVGQFCVADYEVNDVIDALRKERIEVASVAPMLLHTRVNPQLVRFQVEGSTEPLVKALREALRWTGKERMAPEPRAAGGSGAR